MTSLPVRFMSIVLASLASFSAYFSFAETTDQTIRKSQEVTVFTVRGRPDGSSLSRYNHALMELVLKKTEAEFGPFRVVSQPIGGPVLYRSLYIAKKNTMKNLFVVASLSNKHFEGLAQHGGELEYIPFPTSLGIYSYRICFTSKSRVEEFSRVETIEELKNYTIGQGVRWTDNVILRANGFSVVEQSKALLHRMVASDRFDLYCRGVAEIKPELEEQANLANLDYDRSFALYYPMPKVFFTNKKNVEAIERVTKGLAVSYSDGSLLELWKSIYMDDINFLEMKNRRVFKLDNPELKNFPDDYSVYFYDLFSTQASAQ